MTREQNERKSLSQRKFETEMTLAAPPEVVWAAVAEAEQIARWFAPSAEVVPGAGGEVVWSWGASYAWKNVIETWEPGKCLRLRYDSPVDDGRGGKKPLFVEFHLAGAGGKTTLRLVHSGFGPEADFDGEYDGISRGWPVELGSLRLYVERHWGRPRHVAWGVRFLDEEPKSAWQRLTGPGGLEGADQLTTLAEGAPFHLAIPGAEPIRGTTLGSALGGEFIGLATSHGDGWLRIMCERCGGVTQAWLWLALYGGSGAGATDARATAATYQAAFDAVLDRVFGPAKQPAEASA